MDRAVIRELLESARPGLAEDLRDRADRLRQAYVGEPVHLRGLVEISSHCVRNCTYCGLRASNTRLRRYRMNASEVIERAHFAAAFGIGTIVLQAGEDPGLDEQLVSAIVWTIKVETGLAVTLSLGERSERELEAWRRAGADRYLLRFETSNPALYARIHPPRRAAEPRRLALLQVLAGLEYEVGSGMMVGIPGQSWDDLAADLELLPELDLDMVGLGPYIPHPDTPLGQGSTGPSAWDQVPADEATTIRVLALARLLCPRANIPATTALATVDAAAGYEAGLRWGANVVMPELTPARYARRYEIYPGRSPRSGSDLAALASLRQRIEAIGRPVGTGRGDAARTGGGRDDRCGSFPWRLGT